MEKNNSNLNIVVCIVTIAVSQIIFKSIGINNKTAILYDTLIIVGAIAYFIKVIKDGGKMKFTERIFSSILLSIAAVILVITTTLIECYPAQADKLGKLMLILITIDFLSFASFVIYIFIIAYKISRRK